MMPPIASSMLFRLPILSSSSSSTPSSPSYQSSTAMLQIQKLKSSGAFIGRFKPIFFKFKFLINYKLWSLFTKFLIVKTLSLLLPLVQRWKLGNFDLNTTIFANNLVANYAIFVFERKKGQIIQFLCNFNLVKNNIFWLFWSVSLVVAVISIITTIMLLCSLFCAI